jgi:hypothetical protein
LLKQKTLLSNWGFSLLYLIITFYIRFILTLIYLSVPTFLSKKIIRTFCQSVLNNKIVYSIYTLHFLSSAAVWKNKYIVAGTLIHLKIPSCASPKNSTNNYNGCISNCRSLINVVVGADTDHGGLPWLVSAPTSDNLKCTHYNIVNFFFYPGLHG